MKNGLEYVYTRTQPLRDIVEDTADMQPVSASARHKTTIEDTNKKFE